MVSTKTSTGKDAEGKARYYLENQGLIWLQSNFYSRFGEIDIIMQDQNDYVFVEVRKRTSGLQYALESITLSKQQKLIKTAQYFLLKLDREVTCRFDAVVLDDQHIAWLKNIICS
jgi:putative endonuclease